MTLSQYEHLVIRDPGPAPTAVELAQLESVLGASLPRWFKQYLQVANGGYLEYVVEIATGSGETEPISFCGLFSTTSSAGEIFADEIALHRENMEESFSDYLLDGSETRELAGLGISGGELKFEFDSQVGGLMAQTEYLTPRFLTETEIEALRGYTVGQWSDGIGSNFFQERMADGFAPQVLIANEQAVRVEQFD
ncbi:hypothetical protein FB547_12264 [Variovorax beijingensis]|jgi:hypothetical protein|uniref:SMI1/KNR4 family protein n=2 Tax=Variovorax TaxID=34072 RepID=A0AAE4C136_VARPD|nr:MULTISPECIES: SMI1/KNR4 family protein [Variovorax]MDP9968081.1 hypothetical protein [Variovorax paradoxus]MDR6429842.1 hypothetical protein [Variovorax paradoxus]MDR6456223.1 hypothetical protein [Variovorax paradoxus]TWD73572.1 hypothetical protein FB547_12264 [Variovorax beijingensis]